MAQHDYRFLTIFDRLPGDTYELVFYPKKVIKE